jgi:hypothetical protein
MTTLSTPDPPPPLRFVQRKGIPVPEPECLCAPERVSPVAFKRWMVGMCCADGPTEPVPYPSHWRLRFPYEDEPEERAAVATLANRKKAGRRAR